MNGRSHFKYKKEIINDLEPEAYTEITEHLESQTEKVGIFIYKFPAKSNTFVVNELIELAKRNVEFHIYSIDVPLQEDLELFEDQMHFFENKVTYLSEDNMLNWGLFIKNEVALGPNPIRRDIDSNGFSYESDLQSLKKSYEPLKNIINSLNDLNVTKLYSPFANIGAELCMMISFHMRIPFYFTCHSYDLFNMFGYEQLKIVLADGIFCISEYNKKYILSKYDVNPNKIIIKRVNYLIPEMFHNLNIPNDYIFSAGRLIKMKGLDISIKAFKKLSKKYPNLHYYIAGSGPEEETLNDIITKLNLSERVHLLGHIPNNEVLSYIKNANFNILSSIVSDDGDVEGIPTFFIESMSLGVPCIGTNYSGIPELITDGETGYLAKMGSYIDVYKKMIKLYKQVNSIDKDQIKTNCVNMIVDKFDNNKNTEVLIEYLGGNK